MPRLESTKSDSKISILLVDDHRIIRVGVSVLLGRCDRFSICGEAGNGEEAISLAQEHKPAIVLMDVRMPVLNGIDATKRIKKVQPSTGILMLSCADDDDEILAAFAAGADGYCTKDASAEQLELAIMTVIEGVRWIHPILAKRLLTIDDSVSKQELKKTKPADHGQVK